MVDRRVSDVTWHLYFSLVMQLLADIIYFVAYQESTGTDPFDVELTHSDRERPKLLREQNILKQVWTVFSTSSSLRWCDKFSMEY